MIKENSTFVERSQTGKDFADVIFSQLKQWGFQVALNGTEHTHPDFIKSLHCSEDTTSLSLRYAPDGVVAFGPKVKTAYVEVKNSIFIEKNAYENYMRLYRNGCTVAIVVKDNRTSKIGFSLIENIVLKKAWDKDWPYDGNWIYPRKHPDYNKIHNERKGSGTPYGTIDISKLNEWAIFAPYIKGEIKTVS